MRSTYSCWYDNYIIPTKRQSPDVVTSEESCGRYKEQVRYHEVTANENLIRAALVGVARRLSESESAIPGVDAVQLLGREVVPEVALDDVEVELRGRGLTQKRGLDHDGGLTRPNSDAEAFALGDLKVKEA